MDKKLFDEMLRRAARTAYHPPHTPQNPSPYATIDMAITKYTYEGPREELRGKTALGRREFGKFLVQFDDKELPDNLAFGWHEFDIFHFVGHAEMVRGAS